MQFSYAAIFAAMASLAVAQSTVTVYSCSTSVASGAPAPTGTIGTVGTTGVVPTKAPTGSPIAYAGAGSMNAVSGSALGMIIAGGVALLI
ncbi:MAG: hypothetical protein M1818_000968 [Claussenomyces sp. TS43310]|nr:MAG: hypothetical protein M1818_000968 [Claussenomyces sp. TS43310]